MRREARRYRPLKTFIYARRLKHAKPGKINLFRYRGFKIKAYIPPSGREIQILEIPPPVKEDIMGAEKLRLSEDGRLSIRLIRDKEKERKGDQPESQQVAEAVEEYREQASPTLLSPLPKYPIEDRRWRKKYTHPDVKMVNKQMVLVEKISDLFSPLRYIPVPTCLVDSDFMDRISPPRLDESLTREIEETNRKIGESVKREYEELYRKAAEKGLELEKIEINIEYWREYIYKLLEFCNRVRDLFPEEAERLRKKILEAHEKFGEFERALRILVTMGCFSEDPSTGEEMVFICPERISECSSWAMKTVQRFRGWVESLENPLLLQPQGSYPIGLENVCSFVLVHEHAHAATVPRRRPNLDPRIIKTMNEGIAQWITYKVLKATGTSTVLFESHAETLPEEYRFYKVLNQMEDEIGRGAVISAILSWTHAPETYKWEEFINRAKNIKSRHKTLLLLKK
jgi:hypothetical protein